MSARETGAWLAGETTGVGAVGAVVGAFGNVATIAL